MRRIAIVNPLLDKTFKTYVSTDYSSGTSLTVLNNNSFANDDIVVVGEPTEELTEAKDLTGIATTVTLTLSAALNFAHPKGTSVYKSPWDQVSIEGRSSSSGTFAELVATNIQWDSKTNETIYFHSAGTDTWQYRFRFYNTQTTTYSEYSPTLTGAGFERKQVGYMIRQVKKIANITNQKIVTDDEIIRQFNEAQDIIYAHNPRYWFLLIDTYKAGTGIAATAGNTVYTLASYSTFGHLDSLRYHYNSGSISELYHLDKKSTNEFDSIVRDLNDASNDWAQIFKLLPADSLSDNGYVQIYPKTLTTGIGTLYPNYYEKMADLDDVADETQVPLPYILENYALAYVYRVKGNEEKAKVYERGLMNDNPNIVPPHLLLLDKMDSAQKSVQGQPRSLWQFKGQRSMIRRYGNIIHNRDWIKENFMD